jgi:hypothetical protein
VSSAEGARESSAPAVPALFVDALTAFLAEARTNEATPSLLITLPTLADGREVELLRMFLAACSQQVRRRRVLGGCRGGGRSGPASGAAAADEKASWTSWC